MRLFIIMLLCVCNHLVHPRFILFQTDDRFSSSSYAIYDCLYFHSTRDLVENHEPVLRNRYLIPYCRQPAAGEEEIDEFDHITGRAISFDELYQQGITSAQLLSWSAPIDTVERYERNFGNQSDELFYNCSRPWFGAYCQYKFEDNTLQSFYEIVTHSIGETEPVCSDDAIGACYPFLPNCDIGLSLGCLNWREICDGKSDCIGGEDEEFCKELEINECSSDEYRCHYGGQCIPLAFLRDGRSNTDCLDGSDEGEAMAGLMLLYRGIECERVPYFECEERTCRYPYMITCNNDICISMTSGSGVFDACSNYRLFKIHRLLLDSTELCQQTLLCLLGILAQWTRLCPTLYNNYYPMQKCLSLESQCRTQWIALPQRPLLFHFFKLIYFTNRSSDDFAANILPDYVCFDAKRCPGLLQYVNVSDFENISTCSLRRHLPDEIGYATASDFSSMEQLFRSLVLRCLTIGTEYSCSDSSLFHCSRSMKCISYHRVVDGVQDCFFGEDESYPACSLNDSSRFICESNRSICLSSIAVDNSVYDCPENEDEFINHVGISYLRKTLYSSFCDHLTHGPIIDTMIVDEAYCDYWPCNTPYVQCDNTWNCLTGIDELNCPDNPCSFNEHACYSKIFDNIVCLPFKYLYDEPIKDRDLSILYILRRVYFENQTLHNISQGIPWHTNPCIDSEKLYRSGSIFTSDSDEKFCSQASTLFVGTPTNITFNGQILCDSFTYKSHQPRIYFLQPLRLGYLPLISNLSSRKSNIHIQSTVSTRHYVTSRITNPCLRGVPVLLRSNGQIRCLCPPNSFGHRCQWQAQRISLTLQLTYRSMALKTRVFQVILMLIDDLGEIAPNIEQFTFVPNRDCGTKYNLYLLYPERPKNTSRNYSIHIDVFDRMTLTYHISWYLPILYPFLPVNRLAARVVVPDQVEMEGCSLFCGNHGQCRRYRNKQSSFFCQCDPGYSGLTCNRSLDCSCSQDSKCHASSICLCPLHRFGRHCLLQHATCQSKTSPCKNGGICLPADAHISLQEFTCLCPDGHSGENCEEISNYIPADAHISLQEFTCLCPDGHSGENCEEISNYIQLKFDRQLIENVSKIAIHFITAFDHKKHERNTLFRKIPVGQDIVSLHRTDPFHIALVELFRDAYYVAILRETHVPSESIYVRVQEKQRCFVINELVNSTLMDLPFWHRAKYYPLLCRQQQSLQCFYDETHICICDMDRFANCFEFNHSMTNHCHNINLCENGGQCFTNNITCPTTSICVCPRCFYGAKCQFSTRGYLLSLDAIIGYHIKPNVAYSQQSKVVKITVGLSTVMLTIGIISSSLSITAFQANKMRNIGCGLYLLTSSIISLCVILVLTVKVWLLISTQIAWITNRIVLSISCVVTDSILRILMSFNDWLQACVALERFVTVRTGVGFRPEKSKRVAQVRIAAIASMTVLTHLHDPIHRRLVDDFDIDEQRLWCFVRYSSFWHQYDSVMMFLHYLIPFLINFSSVILMIVLMARSRSGLHSNKSFSDHLVDQLNNHKYLLIGPALLIVLTLPRLIIPFYTKCMRTPRNPLLFLVGYFISYTPAVTSFFLFVLPSSKYKQGLQRTFNMATHRIFPES